MKIPQKFKANSPIKDMLGQLQMQAGDTGTIVDIDVEVFDDIYYITTEDNRKFRTSNQHLKHGAIRYIG